MQYQDGETILHWAARFGNFEVIETLLVVYPKSERWQALNRSNRYGDTALRLVAVRTTLSASKLFFLCVRNRSASRL